MELDPEWNAYQCKSGEVLFYYHAVTGEHRWAMHFCSCFNSKITSNSTTEPCCLWEPVKPQTCKAGKFVRSIGTETEDQYFIATNRNEEPIESPRAEITFEYSVSKDRLKGTTENTSACNSDKPVEVFLEDPFVSSGDNQNSSKRITLKLKEISSQEFSLGDNVVPQKVPKKVDDITFPRKGPVLTKSNAVSGSAKDGDVLYKANSSQKHAFMGQRKVKSPSLNRKESKSLSSSSFAVQSHASSIDEANITENSIDSPQAKRPRSSASSRKNPEPRKLLKRPNTNSNSKQSTEEWSDSDMQQYYDEELGLETRMSDGDTEEHHLGEDPLVLIGEPSSPPAVLAKQEEELKEDADDQPSICQLCGKDCATPAMLTNHLMKHQPTGTSCPICKKYFSRRQGLRYHVQTHAGDKPHICKICNKTFTKSASLVAHYRTHSGIRPFKCPKCNKGFTHSSNLSSHLRIHSSLRPYRCTFCSKGFKTSSHLTLHLRCHSDERPYKCAKCGKAFKNSSHLRSHEKLHLLPKNVFCNSCGEGFRSFSNLIHHQQTNPQCAEEDDQGYYQAHRQRSESYARNDTKAGQSHMDEPRTFQYDNDEIERHSAVERQGGEVEGFRNAAGDLSQRQSTSDSLHNFFSTSIEQQPADEEERSNMHQNLSDA